MRKLSTGILLVSLLAARPLSAQFPGAGPSPADVAMTRMSGILNQQSFSARAVITITGGKKTRGQPPGPMSFLMTVSQGKTRTEMDFAQMAAAAGGKDAEMPPGLDKMITITRSDKKLIYQVVPGMNGYCEMPIPNATGKGDSSTKIDRKVEGTEKVENYDCEKVRNTVTTDSKTQEIMTWEAKELKGLPVKIEADTSDGKITMAFKDIKTTKPADSLFEPPAGCTKYGSMQDLMMSGMMKMMPNMR